MRFEFCMFKCHTCSSVELLELHHSLTTTCTWKAWVDCLGITSSATGFACQYHVAL